ncbi:PilX N-terminal domain-containing pilus assembly protein [Janthinobacterium sp. SUN118]|uniref:pilus assembly PilX family protein n=1 Tax=Janthinobacterium sp. SUN118 TaxID=3004100 RepID=UPI0025AECDCF|nr:PilX N-terminal domain-containing pilus assembly protein [Janthinobacterium sp. SUN118]MDN2712708.1 PilX N-terminal domain-containing pilus assembly protein [Janthinobacterium sp. SUN118]
MASAGASCGSPVCLQRGATLVYVLCLLVVILLLGISAAQMALLGEKAARGERDRYIAFQAAEEALMDAQNDIEGLPGAPGRSSLFAPGSAAGFTVGCGDGGELGLCLPAEKGAPALWLSMALGGAEAASGSDGNRTVPYGRFTGAAMQTGQGFLPFRRPRYIIELLPFHLPGEEAGAVIGSLATGNYLYRVTAIGFGAQDSTQVVLQSYYRKQVAGAGP